jgi:hypothetical protein
MLGVPGVMAAFRKGNVALANAIGTGVADDKAVYAYVPKIIRYYLDQDPILPNVETHICREPDALAYTLDNLARLVVKPVGESGGYGMLVGPTASAAEVASFRERLRRDPANYISQPTLLDRRRHRAAPRRSAAVRDHGRRHLGAARRPDAGRAQAGLAGGELEPGRRLEGHVGAVVREATAC